MSWLTETDYEEEIIQPLFRISQAINEINEDILDNFISNSEEKHKSIRFPSIPFLSQVFKKVVLLTHCNHCFKQLFQ